MSNIFISFSLLVISFLCFALSYLAKEVRQSKERISKLEKIIGDIK